MNRRDQVLQLLADGKTRRQAAQELHVTVETVKSHLKRARCDYRARTTVHAVANAIRERHIR